MLVAVLALVPAACGRDEDGGGGGGGGAEADPGITDKAIKLGGSYPFSGPASAYGTIAEGAKALFKYVNAKGGVDGRKIEFITLDDGYEPQRALHQRASGWSSRTRSSRCSTRSARRTTSRSGTTLNQQKVPQLFVATGASDVGRGHRQRTRTRSAGSPTT